MIDESLAIMLVSEGTKHLPLINAELLNNEELRKLSDKQMAIVAICYGAALAKMTHLQVEHYLALAAHAYTNIEVTKNADSPETDSQA